jgi:DNA-binding IclR family transcriptional regulator
VARSPHGLKAREISDILNLPRQATYHLIHTLVSVQILRKNAKGAYVLGLEASAIADGFARHLNPAEYLEPRVRAVVAITGETAYVSGWIEGDIIALLAVRGGAMVSVSEVPTGLASHAHARASGKLLMAFADPLERENYLSRHKLSRRTDKTITTREALDKELAVIRTQGYAIDNEEFAEGLCCLAVPIQETIGRFALCVSAPKDRFWANHEKYLGILRDIAGGELEG